MKKYISQIDNKNFLYPNNNLAEYDIEIIHDVNNNSVSGEIHNFYAVKSGNNVLVTFNYTWYKNGAEPYIDSSNNLHLISLHMMDPNHLYFNPFRCVTGSTTTSLESTTYTSSVSVLVTPSMLGVSALPNGIYSFMVKFIGHRAIYPIYVQQNVIPIPHFQATVSTVSAADACTNPENPSYDWVKNAGTGTTFCSDISLRSTWLDIFGSSYTNIWLNDGTNIREWQVLLSTEGYYYAIPYSACTTCPGASPTPTPTPTGTPTINCSLAGNTTYKS